MKNRILTTAIIATFAILVSITGNAGAQGPIPPDPPKFSCVASTFEGSQFDYNSDDYTTFEMTFDPSACALNLNFPKNPNFFIGNYYLVAHYLIFGEALLSPSIPLGDPFYGHDLLVLPTDVLGPFPGGSSQLYIPYEPALIGLTFYFQGIAEFITTVSFPIVPEYVLTNGVKGVFN
ncbi:MAG: hypothetical protein ACKVS6_03115 [Planctomycetota bacterium]